MPSKSAKKRETLALQTLGEQLLELTQEQLSNLNLDESLFDAVRAASVMNSRGALRRQRQLIGKLMRNVDPEPIRLALDELQRQQRTEKDTFRRAEYWRDRIVTRGREGLNEFLESTGTSNEELWLLLQQLHASRSDSVRTTLRRKIFREVHEKLTVQNSAR